MQEFKKEIERAIADNIDITNLKMYDDFAGELLLQAHSLVMSKYIMQECIIKMDVK